MPTLHIGAAVAVLDPALVELVQCARLLWGAALSDADAPTADRGGVVAGPADRSEEPALRVSLAGEGLRLEGPAALPAVLASVLRPEGYEGALGGAPGARSLEAGARSLEAGARIQGEGALALAAGVPARVLLDAIVAALAAAQPGRLWVHAAAVARGQGAARAALLLTGPSGAGKTTLSLGLADRGGELLGEDLACLVPGAPTVCAVPRTPMLRPPAPTPFTDPDHRMPRSLGAPPPPVAPAALGAVVLLCPGGPRPPEAFTPSVHDGELLRALTASNVVAATFGADDARWLFRWARVVAELAKVPCWRVWPGGIAETLDEIESLTPR